MQVAHAAAGSRRALTRRGSSGHLSFDGGEDEQTTPQPSPGYSSGGSPGTPASRGSRGSSAFDDSRISRCTHAINVFVGRASSLHSDFVARRTLLSRLLIAITESVVVVVALTVIGTVIFSRLERDSDRLLESRYKTVLEKVRNGVSAETYAELGYFVKNQRDGDVWALSHQSSYMFAFSTVTSIGYGVFTPVTQGGQIFFCFYALICIPLCGISFGRVASSIVDLLSWSHECRRRKIRRSFKAADTESRGHITQEQMRVAFESALKYAVDAQELEELLVEIDPWETDRITLPMYAWAFAQLGSLDERVHQKSHRARLTAFMFATWNAVGMIVFHFLEGWGWVESIYFCFETLLTIGLGDFVPNTTNGERFQFLFCVFGLGLLASLITSLAELDVAEENVARAAVDALARQKLRRVSETLSRHNSVEPSTPHRASAVLAQDLVVQHVATRQKMPPTQLSDTPEPAEPAEAPQPPSGPVVPAELPQKEVPPAAQAGSGARPQPAPPADAQLRPTPPSPPSSPPWFVPQAPQSEPPPLQLHSESAGLVSQACIARGAEERARARAERAVRVAARREAMRTGRAEEDAQHANAAQQNRRLASPADWSDA